MGAVLLLSAASAAQTWEIGAAVGTGIYRNATITGSTGSAQAGMENAIAPGLVVCDNMYEHVSGEFRYLYQSGHPFLSQGSIKGTMPGESHTFVYDVLIHFRPRGSWWRPYVAAGAGVKGYMAPGPAPVPEALPKSALLLANNQWEFAGSAGAGIKVKVQEHVLLRLDVRDYITPFPKKQISPATGASVSGLLQQITPMGGVSIVF